MRHHHRHPVFGLSAIRSPALQDVFAQYQRRLVRTGYHPQVVRFHLHAIAHLLVWIEHQGRSLEVKALVREARARGPQGALPPRVFSTLLGLLAATGLRISEALSLQLADVTSDGLVVRRAKFGKSRLLPLHPTTRVALDQYLERRRQEAGACEYLFCSVRGRQLHANTVRHVFRRLVRALGIAHEGGRPRPRLHDLRFYFANQVLAHGPEDPRGIARHVVALTTYLGHSDARDSYWYLEATPQLLARIAEHCEDFVTGGVR